jgi:hypothetical protein
MREISFEYKDGEYTVFCSRCGKVIHNHKDLSKFQLKMLKESPELLVPSYCKKCIYEYK